MAKILDRASFSTTAKGYQALVSWLKSLGTLAKVGVEGTDAYGAWSPRHLDREGLEVMEVNWPNRQARWRLVSPTPSTPKWPLGRL